MRGVTSAARAKKCREWYSGQEYKQHLPAGKKFTNWAFA
jgi:hypothetical protein